MPRAEPPEGWPFPFDPPKPMVLGDSRAMAVNTTDGSERRDFAQSFVTVERGDPVRQTNDAHAYASCTDCETTASAFQVVLIVGQSNEIAPVNAAVAANYHCVRCRTYAFAYQIVASVTEVTPDVEEALEEARRRLQELEANSSSLSGAEIYSALEEIEEGVLKGLEGVIAVDSDSDAATPADPDGQALEQVTPASDSPAE